MYLELSTPKVLTMEFVRGVKITDTAALDEAGLDRCELAHRLIHAVVKQILFDGFFHADPHPGNIFVNLDTGVITFLDTGMMGYLDAVHRVNLGDLIFTLYSGDVRELGRVMIGLSTRFGELDEEAFLRDLDKVVGRYFVFAEADDKLADSIGATLQVMHAHGLRLNPDLTMGLKAIMQAEEAARVLEPGIDLLGVALDDIKVLLLQEVNYDNIKESVQREVTRSVKEVIRRIPSLQEATMRWLDQYESGKLSLHVDTTEAGRQIAQLALAVRQLTIGLTLVGMLIGTALVAGLPNAAAYPSLLAIASIFFFATLILGGIFVLRSLGDLWRR
jgi:ubiquinone biosynthesis protein